MDYKEGDYLLITVNDPFNDDVFNIISQILKIDNNTLLLSDIWVPVHKKHFKADKWTLDLENFDQYSAKHISQLAEEDIYKYLI